MERQGWYPHQPNCFLFVIDTVSEIFMQTPGNHPSYMWSIELHFPHAQS